MNYPLWLEIFLAICMGLSLAGLGAFMLYTFAIRLIRAALRLEDRRTNRETDALNNWKTAYEAERQDHLEDVAELTDRILELEGWKARTEKRMKDLRLSEVFDNE